jgi:hypothetical protein
MSRCSKIVTLTGMAALSVVLFGSSEARSVPVNRTVKCQCQCKTPGTLWGMVTISRQGYFCNPFNGATCNISDPATGGVRSGTLQFCAEESDSANSGGQGTWNTPGKF